jgi:hypothetical protein
LSLWRESGCSSVERDFGPYFVLRQWVDAREADRIDQREHLGLHVMPGPKVRVPL